MPDGALPHRVSTAQIILELFERVNRKYGSVDRYLDTIGLGPAERAEIAAALLTTAE